MIVITAKISVGNPTIINLYRSISDVAWINEGEFMLKIDSIGNYNRNEMIFIDIYLFIRYIFFY